MMAWTKILWLITLIIAGVAGYYIAIFSTPANIVSEGSLVIPAAYNGQLMKWVGGYPGGAPPTIKFFDGEGNSPCNDQPTGTPPSCRVSWDAQGFYPYMLTPGTSKSDPVSLAQIKPCPGCPTKGGMPNPTVVTSLSATVVISVLCQNGAATSLPPTGGPIIGSTNTAPGSAVERLPHGKQSFAVTFDDPAVCRENSSSYGPGQTCTVNKPFSSQVSNSDPYTLNIYTDSSQKTLAFTGK